MKNIYSTTLTFLLVAISFSSCLDNNPVSSTNDTQLVDKTIDLKIETEPKAQLEREVLSVKKEDTPVAEETKPAHKKKKKRTSKRPKVSFEETTFQFGSISQGTEITHKFDFKNTGDRDLLITSVTATCGCTQPSYPFIPIAPGETGFIGVTYNSKGKFGPQKPTLTVVTNANPKTYKLYLNGVVDTEKTDGAVTEKKSGTK